MEPVALFVKSYRRDRHLVDRLLASIVRYNADGLGVFVSVPEEDMSEFRPHVAGLPGVTLVSDEHFQVPLVTEKIWQFAPGYISQQLVKLSVHRLREAHNYVVLDSDTYFIRDFRAADFVASDGVGFTVASSDSDLYADPAYARFRAARIKKLELIAARLGVERLDLTTTHNNAIFQDATLRAFDDWRAAENLSLLDLMRIAPVEFSWYHLFMGKHRRDQVRKIEPFVKMMHTRSEFRRLVRAGYSHATLQRSYLGVCLNSGWAGAGQRRYVSRLERGSRFAEVQLAADRARYTAAFRLELFAAARLGGPARRLRQRRRRHP